MDNFKFILTHKEKRIVEDVRANFATKIENLVMFIDGAIKEIAALEGVKLSSNVIAYMIYTVISDEVKKKIFVAERN